MKKTSLSTVEIRRLQKRYHALATQLGSFDGLSQGSVMPQPPRAWIWTRKVRGKTVTVALSQEKAQKMKQAIANYRALDAIINEMREITQKLILGAPETVENAEAANRPKPALT